MPRDQTAFRHELGQANLSRYTPRYLPPEASGKDTDISEIFASTFRYFAQPSLSPDPLDKLPRPAVRLSMFGDTQLGALGDYLEAALMLRYNKRSVG